MMAEPRVLATLSAGRCPECNYRGFVIGPMGGVAINIECGNLACRARFNATFYAGRCLMAQSIPRESEGGFPWPADVDEHGRGHEGTFS